MGPSVNKGLLRTNTELLSLETKTFLVSECFLGSAQDGLPLGHSASAALPIDKVKQKRGGDRLRSVRTNAEKRTDGKGWEIELRAFPPSQNIQSTPNSVVTSTREQEKGDAKSFLHAFLFPLPFPPWDTKETFVRRRMGRHFLAYRNKSYYFHIEIRYFVPVYSDIVKMYSVVLVKIRLFSPENRHIVCRPRLGTKGPLFNLLSHTPLSFSLPFSSSVLLILTAAATPPSRNGLWKEKGGEGNKNGQEWSGGKCK